MTLCEEADCIMYPAAASGFGSSGFGFKFFGLLVRCILTHPLLSFNRLFQLLVCWWLLLHSGHVDGGKCIWLMLDRVAWSFTRE